MNFDTIKEFPVVVFGNLEKYSDTLSQARVRIFYKGLNRNSTYITDEFAEKLIATLPFSPIKGIYSENEEDFTDHGTSRDQGRAYGVVKYPMNFAWETHLDEDGVEREYACVDVLLWTGIYGEAKKIVGKKQSMELYEPSILGSWEIRNGQKCFTFTDGCFLGLEVLGDSKEPCFEGSAFFTLYESFKEAMQEFRQFTLNSQKTNKQEGILRMPIINFKLSDGAKHNAIWTLLNLNFNEAGGWEQIYAVCDVYDEYAVCFNYEAGCYERIEYTKDDSTDIVTLGKKKKCYIVDVTEEEKTALEALHALNGDTYVKVNENFTALQNEKTAFEQKIEELNNSISTLTTEKENSDTALNTANSELETLKGDLETLKTYKLEKEAQAKKEIISSYETLIDETILSGYTDEKIADYTVEQLDKELAYELVKSNPTVFTKAPSLIPKDDTPKGGIEGILDKYKK